jgi:hypothetical protein
MHTPGFRWQYVRDLALQIVPPEGAVGSYKASYPYQYGIIYVEALFGPTLSRFPNLILASIQHIQRGYFPVLQIEVRSSEHVVTLFKDGEWVKVLADVAQKQTRLRTKKLLAQVVEEDKTPWCVINDCYLFPEYIGRELDLARYPMQGGRLRRWREGWRDIEQDAKLIVQKLGEYWERYGHEGTGNYQGERLSVKLLRGVMSRTRVYIRSPAQAEEQRWRLVLAIDLRGGSRMSMEFKPGKWILYARDLAQSCMAE